LQSALAQLNAMQPKYGSEYDQAVANYNGQVDQFNKFLGQTKSEIAQYNAEVESFNQCIAA
jgi:hypothetical protein